MTFAKSLLLAATLSIAPVAASAAPLSAGPVAARTPNTIEVSLRHSSHRRWFVRAVGHILDGRPLARYAR